MKTLLLGLLILFVTVLLAYRERFEIKSNTLDFLRDRNPNKKAITIGKYLKAFVVENVGVVPPSTTKLGGGITMSLKEYLLSAGDKPLRIEYMDETSKYFWDILIKCMGGPKTPPPPLEESAGTNPSGLHIRVQTISNEDNAIYEKLQKSYENILTYYQDIDLNKLEYFIPFYRFELFGNFKLAVFDDLFYSHNVTMKKEYKKVYDQEMRDNDHNAFFSRFIPFYDTILKQKIERTPAQLQEVENLREETVKRLRFAVTQKQMLLDEKKKELINNYWSNKSQLQKEILELNHDIIQLRSQMDLVAIQELFTNVAFTIDYENFPVTILKAYKDEYKKIRLDKALHIKVAKGDTIDIKNLGKFKVLTADPYIVAENIHSMYFFQHFKTVSVKKDDIEKVFYNDLKETIIATADNKNINPVSDIVWFEDLNTMGHLFLTKDKKTIVAIIHEGLKETRRESEHLCLEDKNILNPDVCKGKGYTWDRMCQSDFDCPYYNPATGRGACTKNTGFCEMPIGAKPVGYTKVEDAKDIYLTEEETPAFPGDNRPYFELFETNDIMIDFSNYRLVLALDPYLINKAAKKLFEPKEEVFRAFPVESKFWRNRTNEDEYYFSSIAVLRNRKVYTFDTLYNKKTDTYMFTKVSGIGKISEDVLQFNSYKDVMSLLSSS